MSRGRKKGITGRDREFLGLLGEGPQFARKTGNLMLAMDVTSPQAIFQRVGRLREFGFPIVYNHNVGGYYRDGGLSSYYSQIRHNWKRVTTTVKRTVPFILDAKKRIEQGEQLALPEPDQSQIIEIVQSFERITASMP